MPKIPPRTPPVAKYDPKDPPLDMNAPYNGGEKEPLQINWLTQMFGFVGINEAKEFPEQGYPEFIVRYLDFKSLRNSIDSVKEYVQRDCPNQRGVIVRLDVQVTKECEAVGPAKPVKKK